MTNGTAPDGQHARISVPGAWPAPVTLAVRPPDQDEATVIPPDAPVQCRKIRQGNQAEITDQLLANAPARQHGQDALWTSLHRAEKAHAAD